MPVKQRWKLFLDLVMVCLLPLLMAYSLIGETLHECLGCAMVLAFLIHHGLNLSWHKNITKGRYTALRGLGTAVGLLLAVILLSQAVSGVVMSQHLFTWLPLSGGAAWTRIAHLLGGYWGVTLMSFHAGLHGGMIFGILRRAAHMERLSNRTTACLRVLAALIAFYGVCAFHKRQIGSYLLLRNQFVFFDFGEPLAFFLLDAVAILALFAIAGHYAAKILSSRNRENPKETTKYNKKE